MSVTWIAPTATICASFAGALAAFALENWHQRSSQKTEHIAAINRVLMNLLLHGRVISHYKREAIGTYDKERPDRAFKVGRAHPFDLNRYRYDFASLTFLSTIKEQQALLKLYEEEDYFECTLRTINIRDKLAYDEIDPAALRAGFADGQERDIREFREVLGAPLIDAYQRKTDELVECVVDELSLINDTIREFRAVAVACYPRAAIIDIDIQEEGDTPEQLGAADRRHATRAVGD